MIVLSICKPDIWFKAIASKALVRDVMCLIVHLYHNVFHSIDKFTLLKNLMGLINDY